MIIALQIASKPLIVSSRSTVARRTSEYFCNKERLGKKSLYFLALFPSSSSSIPSIAYLEVICKQILCTSLATHSVHHQRFLGHLLESKDRLLDKSLFRQFALTKPLSRLNAKKVASKDL